MSQLIEKGQYQQIFENILESAEKMNQDVMKKKNMLLEHIILDREEKAKKKKKKGKKRRHNKKWWLGRNEPNVELFQLPYFKE